MFANSYSGRRRRPRPRARRLQADGGGIRHGRLARRRRGAADRAADRRLRGLRPDPPRRRPGGDGPRPRSHRRARALLASNRECLDNLAANALERETLTREDLDEIFAAHELHTPLALGNARSRRRRAFLGGAGAELASSAQMAHPTDADSHYFPPGRSIARMVHGERSVGLLYGQRALLIGALEPLTYTGTMMSTALGQPALPAPRPHGEDPGDDPARHPRGSRQGAGGGAAPARAGQGHAARGGRRRTPPAPPTRPSTRS